MIPPVEIPLTMNDHKIGIATVEEAGVFWEIHAGELSIVTQNCDVGDFKLKFGEDVVGVVTIGDDEGTWSINPELLSNAAEKWLIKDATQYYSVVITEPKEIDNG